MPLFFYLFTFLLFYLFLHSHTGRSPQGGKDGRRHRGDDLHNPFDSFFLSHTLFKILMVKEFFGTDYTDFHCFIYSAAWSPQALGLAPKYSRERLYLGA
jgi:hypothetical protein